MAQGRSRAARTGRRRTLTAAAPLLLLALVLQPPAVLARAPDVADPSIPDKASWCGDATLGTPTRTTGECICKYVCEGPACVNSQGFKFYGWRDGLAGRAKCAPPANLSPEEKAELAAKRAAQREKLAKDAQESKSRAEESLSAAAESHRAAEASQTPTWAEWLEDLELANVAVAVVATLIFGTVLATMVIMNVSGVKEAVAAANTKNSEAKTQTQKSAADSSAAKTQGEDKGKGRGKSD